MNVLYILRMTTKDVSDDLFIPILARTVWIRDSYDLNKKKPDIRMRYPNGLPTTARVLCIGRHRLIPSDQPANLLVREAFSMANTVRVSTSSIGWLWTTPRKQGILVVLRWIYAFLVQLTVLDRSLGEHNCRQRLS